MTFSQKMRATIQDLREGLESDKKLYAQLLDRTARLANLNDQLIREAKEAALDALQDEE